MPRVRLSWIVAYFLALAIAGTLGSYLAYESPLASQAWRCWSGASAWQRDGLRAVVVGLLSLIALLQLQAITNQRHGAKVSAFLRPRDRWDVLLLLLVACLPLVSLYFQIASFTAGLPARCPHVPQEPFVREILLPYLPYLAYEYALWLGLSFPTLLSSARWIRRDINRRGVLLDALGQRIRAIQEVQSEPSTPLNELVVAYQNYVVWLKDVAERYLVVVVLVSIGLLHEHVLSELGSTTTPVAHDIAKLGLNWLLLGPALFVFIGIVAFGYQRTSKRIRDALGGFTEAIATNPSSGVVFAHATKLRSDLIWERNATQFVLAVVKSAGIAMPLVLAVGGYVATVLFNGKGWLYVFVPEFVIDALKRLYGG